MKPEAQFVSKKKGFTNMPNSLLLLHLFAVVNVFFYTCQCLICNLYSSIKYYLIDMCLIRFAGSKITAVLESEVIHGHMVLVGC